MPHDSVPAQSAKAATPRSSSYPTCLSSDLGSRDLDRFNEIAIARRVERGASLFHGGDPFASVYTVRSGTFKTMCTSRHGNEKVTGFHLAGEMLGLEGINTGRHACGATALEDSEVYAIPFAALEKMALAVPALQHQLFRLLSSDISRDQGLLLLLGSMDAGQRLAAFLLSLSRRYQSLGFAANRFILRMSRDEIGSYLGLTLETVSRMLTRFQREGLIDVHGRDIELKNTDRLRDMVGR